ncbi:MAG: helix-turn-helix transcriptional regulator [Candidatus Omnitrophota bacterium]
MTITKRIKELRTVAKLSQTALAKKIGARYASTISNWENGVGEPNSIFRKKLCKVFSISEADFFTNQAILKDSSSIKYLNSEVIAALQDPVAVKALLLTYKSAKDIKKAIKILLNTMPGLTREKRNAILALCK